jgi:phage anti-repressor protein
MNQNIQISPQKIDGVQTNTVNARELHEALGIKKDFSSWIKPKLEDAMLDEGTDYIKLTQKGELSKTGQWSVEYILTLDTAKHIAMMSRTAKGKEVRAYFIEVEKQSQQVKQNQSLEFTLAKSLEAMAEGIGVLAKTMKSIDARVTRLEASTKPSIVPPTPHRVMLSRQGYLLQLFAQLIEINPGINQSQLLTLAGQRRDDKRARRILQEMQGVLWESTMYANQILYYRMGN